jgi:hypothetical protein
MINAVVTWSTLQAHPKVWTGTRLIPVSQLCCARAHATANVANRHPASTVVVQGQPAFLWLSQPSPVPGACSASAPTG